MKKHIILLLASSFFIPSVFAKTPGGGTFTYTQKVSANVRAICNFSSAKFDTFNFGTFTRNEMGDAFYGSFGCARGANMQFSLSLGSNPQSTSEKRRMPLNGEQGDVKNFVEYQITLESQVLGTEDYAVTVHNYSSNYVTIRGRVFKDQNNIVPGKYFDTLALTIDYF